jgi:hypothetical protein
MSPSDQIVSAGADEPMDELDAAILAGVREYWESVDPVPSMLVDRIRFAIDLENVDVEVLRLTELEKVAAARGDENSRMITFDSRSLTIMIGVGSNADDTYRIDGWLTPPASHPIELRTGERTLDTESDASGRFAFGSVAAGLVQLVVRREAGQTVTTPAFSL